MYVCMYAYRVRKGVILAIMPRVSQKKGCAVSFTLISA